VYDNFYKRSLKGNIYTYIIYANKKRQTRIHHFYNNFPSRYSLLNPWKYKQTTTENLQVKLILLAKLNKA